MACRTQDLVSLKNEIKLAQPRKAQEIPVGFHPAFLGLAALFVRPNSQNDRLTVDRPMKEHMTIILQREKTSAFVMEGLKAWTSRREKLHAFPNHLGALMFCYDRQLKGMQIVSAFPDKTDFAFPVLLKDRA